MKRLIAFGLSCVALIALSGCENMKYAGGNQMVEGSRTYYYALVYSQFTETKYYHIKGWAEYDPEGGGKVNGVYASYVGLELQLNNGDVIYRYEIGLSYELSKQYNPKYGVAIGD